MLRRIAVAVAVLLLTGLAPALAAAPTPAEIDAAEARFAEGQAAAQRGDEATAMRLIGEAARLAQNGELAHRLGHLYEGRTGLPNHQAEALSWFQYAAELKQADAMHHVGMRYIEGSGGLARDVRKGVALMEASADAGYQPAFGVASRFRDAQDQKARCLLSALRTAGMRDVPFGQKLIQIRAGEGRSASGDVYELSGFSGQFGASLAALDVKGFTSAEYLVIDGRGIYSDVYGDAAPSGEAQRLAASLRAQCAVEP